MLAVDFNSLPSSKPSPSSSNANSHTIENPIQVDIPSWKPLLLHGTSFHFLTKPSRSSQRRQGIETLRNALSPRAVRKDMLTCLAAHMRRSHREYKPMSLSECPLDLTALNMALRAFVAQRDYAAALTTLHYIPSPPRFRPPSDDTSTREPEPDRAAAKDNNNDNGSSERDLLARLFCVQTQKSPAERALTLLRRARVPTALQLTTLPRPVRVSASVSRNWWAGGSETQMFSPWPLEKILKRALAASCTDAAPPGVDGHPLDSVWTRRELHETLAVEQAHAEMVPEGYEEAVAQERVSSGVVELLLHSVARPSPGGAAGGSRLGPPVLWNRWPGLVGETTTTRNWSDSVSPLRPDT
ncbi:hypothetical protein V8D89_008601 [Ganoderma adspersum]